MPEFRDVTAENVRAICELQIAPHQKGLVSPAAYTLAESAFEAGAHVRAIYDGAKLAGLLALIDTRQPCGDREIRRDAAYLWRLLIAEAHQGKGHGGAAIAEALRVARDWGFDKLTLSVANRPDAAVPFYQRHGFRLTGRGLYGGEEREMLRDLAV
ncbi:MAG: GNAT family N-acetyltransferase [Pseudomonadota bacterium]